MTPSPPPRPTLAELVEAAAQVGGVTVSGMLGRGRHTDYIRARELMVCAAHEVGYSFPECDCGLLRKSLAMEAYQRVMVMDPEAMRRTLDRVNVVIGEAQAMAEARIRRGEKP